MKDDPDLAIDAAGALDLGHAGHAEQPLGHRIVDVPAQFLERHVDRAGREAGNLVVEIDASPSGSRIPSGSSLRIRSTAS